MTKNQVDYWRNQEIERNNRAVEIETNRSNLAKEEETRRSNMAREAETHRANYVKEVEARTDRIKSAYEFQMNQNLQYSELKEAHRSNLAKEKEAAASRISDYAARTSANKIQAEKNQISRQEYEEDRRRNNLNYASTMSSIAEQRRANLAREAETNRANLANEAISRGNLDYNFRRLDEQRRSNMVNERLTSRQQLISLTGSVANNTSNLLGQAMRSAASARR